MEKYDEKYRTKNKKYVKEDPVGFISFLMILLFIFLAVFADFIAPYGINETQYMKPKAAPSMEHIFGTDELSRDIFSRILYASRISLFIGFAPTTINLIIGTLFGNDSWNDYIKMGRYIDYENC